MNRPGGLASPSHGRGLALGAGVGGPPADVVFIDFYVEMTRAKGVRIGAAGRGRSVPLAGMNEEGGRKMAVIRFLVDGGAQHQLHGGVQRLAFFFGEGSSQALGVNFGLEQYLIHNPVAKTGGDALVEQQRLEQRFAPG